MIVVGEFSYCTPGLLILPGMVSNRRRGQSVVAACWQPRGLLQPLAGGRTWNCGVSQMSMLRPSYPTISSFSPNSLQGEGGAAPVGSALRQAAARVAAAA